MNDLPRDMLALVLTFLPIKECQTTTLLVCKALHEASKHPMCWDVEITLDNDASIAQAVSFFTNHHCTPRLVLSSQGPQPPSCCSLHSLSLFTDLRVLQLSFRDLDDVSGFPQMLSALNQLEKFVARLEFDLAFFIFPPMPCLQSLELRFASVNNLDTTSLVNLADLNIDCHDLLQSSFPDSLKSLTLGPTSCSSQVLSSVARLPNLTYLMAFDDILSHPHLCFTSTITTLMVVLPDKLSCQGRENLRQMSKLTGLFLAQWEMTAADAEVIESLPSLTALRFDALFHLRKTGIAPFPQTKSLHHLKLHYFSPPFSLHAITPTSLRSLVLLGGREAITCLSPMAALINLTAFQTDVVMSEQDAQVVSGLTLMERLSIVVASEACLVHICTLPRLKWLCVCAPESSRHTGIVGLVAAKALVDLAPTIEHLSVPCLVDSHAQAVVRAVSQLTLLGYFSTFSILSDEQVSVLRNGLPRLCELHHSELALRDLEFRVGVHVIDYQ